jgi:DNA-binding IclR family transcriptional regulator
MAVGRARSTAPAVARARSSDTGQHLKTVDRALRVLELLAEEPEGLSVGDLAERLAAHRTIVYRLLSTLREHRLVRRDRNGYRLGTGVLELAQAVAPALLEAAAPFLTELANELDATAYLTLSDGDEALVALTAEPVGSHVHVAFRVGFRHPLPRGASGIAILAGRPRTRGERAEITAARRIGYASTVGELTPGLHGVAAPVRVGGSPAEASVGAVTAARFDVEAVGARIVATAQAIARSLAY